MELEELFRSKLENADAIPSMAVRQRVMKKLAVKEFLHFNPVKFNIYYLGGLIVAGIVAALLLFSDVGSEDVIKPESIPGKPKIISDTIINNEAGREVQNLKGLKFEKRQEPVSRQGARESQEVIKDADKGNILIEPAGDSIDKKDITVSITDKNISVDLMKTPLASFKISASDGCTPLKVKFFNKSSLFDSCHWSFGDGGSSSQVNPEWIYDNPGTYLVTLNVYRSSGIFASASDVITVYPRPEARFEVQEPDPSSDNDLLQMINYSTGAVKYRWEFGDGTSSMAFEPTHKYEKLGTYNIKLTVWSEHGCVDTSTFFNITGHTSYYIRFPNAFMPNKYGPTGGLYNATSDAFAHIFHPVAHGVAEYNLKIFTRNGILVFESNDINIGWDGYNKGNLCEPGVYIWKASGTFKNGEAFVKIGDVTLLRSN